MQRVLKRAGRALLWTAAGVLGVAVVAAVVGFLVVRGLVLPDSDRFGTVQDEAKTAGVTADDLAAAGDPYFAAMDKGLLLEPADGESYPKQIREVAGIAGLPPEAVRQAALRGQNMWMVWTGGNDRFWDFAARTAIGSFDLLKTISSYKGEDYDQAYGRANRFRYLGLMNEPCFEEATGPDPARFGLWLDRRRDDCPADPFADAGAYPGVEIGARGQQTAPELAERFPDSTEDGALPVGSYYGEPTGVLGLRLFTNPDFDAEAAEAWDPERFYTDPDYYNDAELVRPYRVGMSCAFCHVGPSPVRPPSDVEAPEWENLASNPGAQYFWVDRIFFWNTRPRPEPGVPAPNEGNFLYQIFHTNPPGSLDTSLVSTDYMNNPRTMNAVYEVLPRLEIAAMRGSELLAGDERFNRQFQDFPQTGALASLYDETTGKVASMRVLKDGSDSVGTLGALNRVYLNIGLFSEEWVQHFRPFIGGQKISPIRIEDAQRNSVYWQATENQTPDMAIFFLVTARADRLADAPGGREILDKQNPDQVRRGKIVFAETCAACHTDDPPEPDPAFGVDAGICEGGGAGPDYRQCWDRYWAWAQSDDFKTKMVEKVLAPDFLEGNYLSSERRVPLDVLGTNACSAVATNGLKGDIWDNFTSSTYKTLPPPREVTVHHPESGGASPFQPLGNGRGYIRPASLVSLWSTAPYLLNNSVGHDADSYGAGYRGSGASYAETVDPETEEHRYDASAQPGIFDGMAAGPEAPAEAEPAGGSAVSGSGYAEPDAASDAPEAQAEYGGSAPAGDGADGHGGYGGYGATSCPAADPTDPYMPCVANRLVAFERSIREMLSPARRRADTRTGEPVPGYIYRTTAPSCLVVPPKFSPGVVQRFSGLLSWAAPWAVTPEGGIELGPFPEGFPVNALANTKLLPDNDEPDMLGHSLRLARAAPTLLGALRDLGGQCAPEELGDPGVQWRAEEAVREWGLVDTLVGLSKCPDYVVNRGHAFGADLSEADREALIAFLKRF